MTEIADFYYHNRVVEFLATIQIRDVIQGLDKDDFVTAPAPCPNCGEYEIFIVTNRSYMCVECRDEGTAAEYVMYREGFGPTEAILEIARRTNKPDPLDPIH